MSDQSEIPCSACHRWNAQAKSFSCNPHKCNELSEWLFAHAQVPKEESLQIQVQPPMAQVQYVV